MTAQGPWKMSRSSINIRQVSIIVCPFSSALIYAISEMWKRQIIWGCGRRRPPSSFNQDASDVSLWEIWHSSLPLWIFCQGCYYFSLSLYHKDVISLAMQMTHAHTHTHTNTPVSRTWCEDTTLTLLRRSLFDFHYQTVTMRPPTHANVWVALHFFVWLCRSSGMHNNAHRHKFHTQTHKSPRPWTIQRK